jgi:putative solute:sodium symporter small subunit
MNESHNSKAKAYWQENIRLVISLLAIWFFVSFFMAILFVDTFDSFRFFGFKLGFWMAQQGSIYCFVIIIFIYVYKMNKLDNKYGMSEDCDEIIEENDYNQKKRADK